MDITQYLEQVIEGSSTQDPTPVP